MTFEKFRRPKLGRPPDGRTEQAAELRYEYGLPIAAIAAELGLTPSAVRQRLASYEAARLLTPPEER